MNNQPPPEPDLDFLGLPLFSPPAEPASGAAHHLAAAISGHATDGNTSGEETADSRADYERSRTLPSGERRRRSRFEPPQLDAPEAQSWEHSSLPTPSPQAASAPVTPENPQPGTSESGRGGAGIPLTADAASVPTYPPAAGSESRRGGRAVAELDWGLVNGFRTDVSNRLSTEIAKDETLDGEARLEVGRSLIVMVLREHVDTLVRQGLQPWDVNLTNRMQKAIYDSLFRLGRLQELVDDPEVENVMIFGHDKVWVDYGGGRFEERASVADSDQQLIEDIQFLAARDGERGRPWSAAEWQLSLSLPGGERLQASHPPITPRPTIVIRRHPPITWTLDDLIERGTLTEAAAEFLRAAVTARKSIVVVGQQGAGKTTFTRALCHVIPPLEHIVTIESERELFLHKSDLHPLCTSFEARPGQGEPNPDGSRPGEVNVEQLIPASLRHNTQRIIVGEVRGPEMIAMLQAMQSGAGSISTIHANSPADAVERMAVLLSQRGAPSEFGYKLIAQHIDFVVQLSNHLQGDRTEKRFVTEISELVAGEGPRPVAQSIFKASPGDDHAEVVGLPQNETLAELELVGFDSERWLRPGLGRVAS